MPPRSFYRPPDFEHIVQILLDLYGKDVSTQLYEFAGKPIPPLIDEASLPAILGVHPRVVEGIRHNRAKHYRRFPLNQTNGKTRIICAPRTYLKVIQWWMQDNILYRENWPDHIHGFVKGRSALTNARAHYGSKHVLNVDIKDFFPSIKADSVEHLFREFGYNRSVSRQISDLCTFEGSLPQGAPTSPTISNFVAFTLDSELKSLSNRHRLIFTRYADDITFSGNSYISFEVYYDVKKVIEKNGFSVNERKVRFSGPGDRMDVTGLVINEKPQMSRAWRNRVRAIFDQAKKNPHLFSDSVDTLCGYIGMIATYDGYENSALYKKGLEAIDIINSYNRF